MEELVILKNKFQAQFTETAKDIQELNQKLTAQNEKLHQLRGAIYSLETLETMIKNKSQEQEA